jgi:hypothetical protein
LQVATIRISSDKRALLILADIRINTTKERWRDSLLRYLAHDWNRQKGREALLSGSNCHFYVEYSAMKEKQSHDKEYVYRAAAIAQCMLKKLTLL